LRKPFGPLYSKYYDLLYSDKDYEAECDYVVSLFREYSKRPVRSILELGAGTGGYSMVLGRRGYAVLGVDASKDMLDIARSKAAKKRLESAVRFRTGDIKGLRLGGGFDACICMFAVMNYLGSIDDVKAAFRSVADSVGDGGLFIFDYWNGDAALALGPSPRHKIVKSGDTVVIRVSDPTPRPDEGKVDVRFTTFVLEKKRLVHEFVETHQMRYLFRDELQQALSESGFSLESLHPFMKPDSPVTPRDWSVTAVARRVR